MSTTYSSSTLHLERLGHVRARRPAATGGAVADLPEASDRSGRQLGAVAPDAGRHRAAQERLTAVQVVLPAVPGARDAQRVAAKSQPDRVHVGHRVAKHVPEAQRPALVRTAVADPVPGRRAPTNNYNVIVRPASKPSSATISFDHVLRNGRSVVITITASGPSPVASLSTCPTAAETMLMPCSPKCVPTRPIIPGMSP